MHLINTLFGEGSQLNALQMSCRAIVIYIIALTYIRLAGKRAFSKISSFDHIIAITMGAMLSRVIVGISPFIPIVVSTFVLIFLHRFVAWITMKNRKFGKLIKGEAVSLYQNGVFNWKNMHENQISQADAMEGLRTKANRRSFDEIDELFLERNGDFSVITKEKTTAG